MLKILSIMMLAQQFSKKALLKSRCLTACGLAWMLLCSACNGGEVGSAPVYGVAEIVFQGPSQKASDLPARDVDFKARFQHQSGAPEITVHGFWDGDGKGGLAGDVFKIRFCPTKAGRWNLVDVSSNQKQLAAQHQGDYVTGIASKQHGFWEVDDASPGRRWYRRSDGTHQYIFGNTLYTFITGYQIDGQPTGVTITDEVARNAEYFKKIRFGVQNDRCPHPIEKPWLDENGAPTNNGNHSARPNPRWFHQQVDEAVRNAWEHDLIADLILCGPDTEESRSSLNALHNGGDPTPYLKYIAARYGSFPNVWICLSNEYDIKKPNYTKKRIAELGGILRRYLPYATPLSVHDGSKIGWSAEFDRLPPWADHQIIQKKIRTLAPAADEICKTWKGAGEPPRNKPTIDDELSYQGEGDKHNEGDTMEAHLGAFLGGGYGTTGFKTGNKTGHYFWGKFDPAEHTAADKLKFLREIIDTRITFWNLAPDTTIFPNLDKRFRALAWPEHEYVLGTDSAAEGLVAQLPAGQWTVTRHDIVAKETKVLSPSASGEFRFDAPDSRAVLFHFRKN